MVHFSNRTVLLTGAASGIGRALALELARAGANLAVCDQNSEPLSAVAKEIRAAGRKALKGVLDVRDSGAVSAFVEEAENEIGEIDILINSAGILMTGSLSETSEEVFRRVMDTNFFGTLASLKAVVPRMQARRRGTIVNISSMAGLHGLPFLHAYCASKFAVYGLSQALAHELSRDGVAVHVVCPPPVDTPMVRNQPSLPPIFEKVPPINVDQVIRAILRGIRRGRFMILVTRESKLQWRIERLIPGVVDRLVERLSFE